MKRLDIKAADVFLSWTGDDAGYKDKIISYLEKCGLVPLESQSECTGQYLQWSVEAAKSATIFLLLLTQHTHASINVPLEILSALTMDDVENRIIVVCENQELYRTLSFDRFDPERCRQAGFSCETFDPDELHRRKLSVIELGKGGLTQEKLEEIAHKTQLLIVNRAEHIFRERQKPNYIRLASFSMQRGTVMEGDFQKLYQRRTVTESESGEPYGSAEIFFGHGIYFLYGPAGSGKTQYIDQIRVKAPEDTVVLSLSCAKTAMSEKALFEDMFGEFMRVLGDRVFYSPENFRRLLSNRHIILILDGMDEIATERGIHKFLQKVEEFYLPHREMTTLLFTGRDEKASDMISFGGDKAQKFKLNELSEEDLEALGEALFLLFGAGDKGREFYIRIKDLNHEIKANPLLLTQLAIIYEKEGTVPETIVGIFDAISKITFRMDTQKRILEVPEDYEDMIRRLSGILKQFSMERYRLMSEGRFVAPVKIFSKILSFYEDRQERAQFLLEYLESRAILIDGEFYHKLFLEYFTAVGYYERCYDDYDELEYPEELQSLFAHYREDYWAQVLQMFLIKADSLIDGTETDKLYSIILSSGAVTDYTLLFDACRDLIRHKQEAQTACVSDLLNKSAQKIYPPYGPLFWYVPEYDLYETTLMAAERMMGNEKALSLARDVCYLYAHKYHCADVTQKVNARALWEGASPKLKGVRRALIEQFLLGDTKEKGSTSVYPRCFNLAEVRALEEGGCGIGGRMTEPFQDELGLYEHTALNEFEGECYGFVSCAYDDDFEDILRSKTTRRVTGLAFSPAGRTTFSEELRFYCKSLSVLYCSEDTEEKQLADYYLDGSAPAWTALLPSFTVTYYGIFYLSERVRLPEFWTEVPYRMFECCSRLRAVILPESVTEIGESAFQGCGSLQEVVLPESVIEIGESAFQGCGSLQEIRIPDKVTKIKDFTFYECDHLQKIVIPAGVKEIGSFSFSDCCSLQTIVLPNGVTKIGDNAFYQCKSLQKVVLPESVTEIGENVFSFCAGLREICLSDSISEIPEEAFGNCENLDTICIPAHVTKIGIEAFENCRSLQKIKLPNGVTKIGASAFQECSSLQEVVLPESVTEIGEYAFSQCASLHEIKVPERVRTIGEGAFICEHLRKISLSGHFRGRESQLGIPNTATIVWIDNAESLRKNTLKDRTKIGEGEFLNRFDLTDFSIPKGIVSIGPQAFRGCENLKSISIPKTVTKICSEAFGGCTALQAIHLPDSITEIEDEAFSHCSDLHEISLPKNITEICDRVFQSCGSLQQIKIPESVKVIGDDAFAGCENLRTLCLPHGLEKIGGGAFGFCHSLQELLIPRSVTFIGFDAFICCENLKRICLPPALTSIEIGLFASCSSLQEIEIPRGVEILDACAFENCAALREIVIPEGVTEIGVESFSGCSSLRKIDLPNVLYAIGKSAFQNCSSLREIVLSEALEMIKEEAFKGCSSLEEIIIPRGVYEIGDDAFADCTALQKVVMSKNFKGEIKRIFGDIKVKIEFI